MKLTRQHVLLAVLGVLLLVVVFQYLPSSSGEGVARAMDPRSVGADLELPPELETDLLAENEVVFNPSGGRNLFAYGEPPRPAAPPKTTKPAPKRPVRPSRPPGPQTAGGTPGTRTPPPPPQPAAPAAPQPPKADFQYIGYIGPVGGRIAVFTVRTEDGVEIALAREGEIPRLDSGTELETVQENLDRFIVRRIGYEDVEVGYTDELFKDQSTTLLMGGRT